MKLFHSFIHLKYKYLLLTSKIPFGHVAPYYCHGIHIPMQSSTGKTISECFVELENANDANEAIKLRKFVKGRLISVVPASQQELMDRLFPGIQLHDNESFELIPGLSIENNQTCTFLSQEEINGILMVCKRFKVSIFSKSKYSFIFLENVQNDLLNW